MQFNFKTNTITILLINQFNCFLCMQTAAMIELVWKFRLWPLSCVEKKIELYLFTLALL